MQHVRWPTHCARVQVNEWVAGFVYLGTCRVEVPDRPRPDVGTLVTWA